MDSKTSGLPESDGRSRNGDEQDSGFYGAEPTGTSFDNPAYEVFDHEVEVGYYQLDPADTSIQVFKELPESSSKKLPPHHVTFTWHKRCGPKRISLAILLILLLAALAVAIYFLVKHFTKEPVVRVTPDIPEGPCQGAVGSFKILDVEYKSDYDNHKSASYLLLSNDLKRHLDNSFNNYNFTKKYDYTLITGFSAGSIVTAFDVMFEDSFPGQDLYSQVWEAFYEGLHRKNDGSLYMDKYLIKEGSLKLQVLEASFTTQSATTSTDYKSPTSPSQPKTTGILSSTAGPSTRASTTLPARVTPLATTPLPIPVCQPITIPQCQNPAQVEYNMTGFPNFLGNWNQSAALGETTKYFSPLIDGCHPHLHRFICALLVPKCVGLHPLPPCKNLCKEVRGKCAAHLDYLLNDINCDTFNDDDTCVGAPALELLDVRLVGGAGPYEGRVEIFRNGQYGTICDDRWDREDANVVCKQLGYLQGGVARTEAYFGEGRDSIVLTHVSCVGNEDHLSLCPHPPWDQGAPTCTHREDAGVTCLGPGRVPLVSFRLSGGEYPYIGRVEVFYRGEWGTVCKDLFEQVDAEVTCRSLGYSGEVPVILEDIGQFGPLPGEQIWLDNIECTGTEDSLALCEHRGWGKHNCDGSSSVAIQCLTPPTTTTTTTTTTTPSTTTTPLPPDYSVRLVGGPNPHEGRVEVMYNRTWGTICNDHFTQENAAVLCRMMGYTGRAIYMMREYNAGSGPIWLDSLDCNGLESSIVECSHDGWGVSNCGHEEDTTIMCYNGRQDETEAPEIVLTTEESTTKMTSTAVPSTEETTSETSTTTPTTTSSTTTTTTTTSTTTTTTQTPMQTVGQIDVRLVNGPSPSQGRVEVLYNNTWGTICNDMFDDNAAMVICRMLGYSGRARYELGRYGRGTGQIWLSHVVCIGTEDTLLKCFYDDWGDNTCDHMEDVSISCWDGESGFRDA